MVVMSLIVSLLISQKLSAKKHGSCSIKKNIDLDYVGPFDYKFIVITKIDILRVIWIQHIYKVSLRFVIYYLRNQWKKNNQSTVFCCKTFQIKILRLMPKITIYLKKKEERQEILIGHPRDRGKSNMNLRICSFQHGGTDA